MHSRLDQSSPPRVEESIRGVQLTAGNSRSSSHSIWNHWLKFEIARHWHFNKMLSLCTPCKLGSLPGGHPGSWEQLGCSQQSVISGNVLPALHRNASKSTENWVPAELLLQPDLQEQSWCTRSSFPAGIRYHHWYGYADYWQATWKLRLCPNADRAVASDIIFWYKKKTVMKLQRDLYLSSPKKTFHFGLGSRQLMLKFVPLQQKYSAFSTCLTRDFLNKDGFPSQASVPSCSPCCHRPITEWKRL